MNVPSIKEGDSGDDVKTLQRYLNARVGLPSLTIQVDGKYGQKTRLALDYFQREAWLNPVSSALDKCTWNALRGAEAYAPIYHGIKPVAQPDQRTCWAACVSALTKKSIEEVLASTPKELCPNGTIKNFSDDNAWTKLKPFAEAHDLMLESPKTWVLTEFRNLIKRSPVILHRLDDAANYFDYIPTTGHFVLVVGIRGDADMSGQGTTLRIQDPLPENVGSEYSVNYKEYMEEFEAATYGVLYRKEDARTAEEKWAAPSTLFSA